MVTVMEELDPLENRLLYNVPDGYVLSLTDWSCADFVAFRLVYPDSTETEITGFWGYVKILRTGLSLPSRTAIWGTNLNNEYTAWFAFSGQLLRE